MCKLQLFGCIFWKCSLVNYGYSNPKKKTAQMGVSKNRGGPPKWMVKIMENPMNKWMIWGYMGVPLFLKTALKSDLQVLLYLLDWGIWFPLYPIHRSQGPNWLLLKGKSKKKLCLPGSCNSCVTQEVSWKSKKKRPLGTCEKTCWCFLGVPYI